MAIRKLWRKRGIITEMLVPFSVLWYAWQRIREIRSTPEKLAVPIICVGNLTAGGAGKTPTAMAIAHILKEQGHRPAFISRGYGGSLKSATKVDHTLHTYRDVGDEPLLLVHHAPCYIARKRVDAAKLAINDGATILIADDGMQNFSFIKDLTLLVVDGGYGFGNGLVIPAGPLRDKIELGLTKAQAVIMIGTPSPKTLNHINQAHLPIYYATLEPDHLPDTQQPFIAFAGIGLPEKFFMMLQRMGVFVKQKIAFPDHHPYRHRDLKKLLKLAEHHRAKLLTTEKDALRLPKDFRDNVTIMPVTLQWQDVHLLKKILKPFAP